MADTGNRGRRGWLCPILHLVGEALHCSTPPTPKRPKQKKRNTQTEVKKCGLEGGWCGRFKKKNDGHTTGGGFIIAYHVPLFPLFPANPLPLDRNIFSYGFFHLAQKTFWVLWPARVTNGTTRPKGKGKGGRKGKSPKGNRQRNLLPEKGDKTPCKFFNSGNGYCKWGTTAVILTTKRKGERRKENPPFFCPSKTRKTRKPRRKKKRETQRGK
jgi:hypothetical protein